MIAGMLIGALIALLFLLLGRLLPERRALKASGSPEPVCGCKHHHSFHDPKTGQCHSLMYVPSTALMSSHHEAPRSMLAEAEAAFDAARSPLPEFPDRAPAEAWLQEVRRAYYGKPEPLDVEPYKARAGAPDAILCDIDGTLAIRSDRSPYDYSRCGEDTLNHVVADYLRTSYGKHGGLRRIILLSGRPETARADTQAWLTRHRVPSDELYMRAAGDFHSDVIVKSELFDTHVRDRFNVRLVLDDRVRVINLWRSLGLSTWQVNDGDF